MNLEIVGYIIWLQLVQQSCMMSALALTLTELNIDWSVFSKYFDMYKKYHLCGFVQRFYSFIFIFMMNDKISFQMQRNTTQFSIQQPYNPAQKPTSKHWPKPKKYTQVSYSADTKITSQPLLSSTFKYWTWDTPWYFHCSCIDPLTFWSARCHCLDGLFVLSLSTFIDQIMCRNYFWFSI